MVKVWKSFGASVIGPGHITTCKPNQDAWLGFHHTWGEGIVVSDGLGSKQYSDLGSHSACLAVAQAVCASSNSQIEKSALCEKVKDKWLSLISPLEPKDCAATCLFAYRTNERTITLGMLGDGLVAVVKNDGSVESLTDAKAEGFSNITVALSAKKKASNWQIMSVPEDECQSIILCTDGVSEDLSDTDGFVKEFCSAHRNLASVSAARNVRKMLENWPTPKHSDDKTIACLFCEEVTDE
jgi:serine/threonine protein phosphatase PrpC